jgi:hypothetical protein
MKKIALIIAAIFTMVQMNAASSDAATATEAPVVAATADEDNDVTYDHPFKSDDDTKHWSIMTSGVYIGMGVSHSLDLINNSFEIGLLNVVAVNYNSLHGQNLSLGAGIHHRSYSIKRPNMLVRENDVVVPTAYPSLSTEEIKDRSSNLNMWTVQFPLMFKQRIVKKLELGVAGILNWNTYARVDNHYELNKTDYDTHYKGLKQNKVNFDFMGSLTWNDFGVYCRYSPGKFFKDGYGPEIKNTWTLGLVFGL